MKRFLKNILVIYGLIFLLQIILVTNFTAGKSDVIELDYSITGVNTVSEPTGSTVWFLGDSYNIFWTGDTIGSVKITLYLDSTYVRTITASTPNDGEYEWTVSSSLVPSDYYQIKIELFWNKL